MRDTQTDREMGREQGNGCDAHRFYFSIQKTQKQEESVKEGVEEGQWCIYDK